MEFINGVRQSPFYEPHWTDGLQQYQIVDTFLADGRGRQVYDEVCRESVRENYFVPVTEYEYVQKLEQVDSYFKYDLGAAGIIETLITYENPELISYTNREAGALIRFNHNSLTAIATMSPDILLEEAQKMDLNNAQVVELERLLNKVGRTLDITLPVVPSPEVEDVRKVLEEITLKVIEAKPGRGYNIFRRRMLEAGTPVNMKSKEFVVYAQNILNSAS